MALESHRSRTILLVEDDAVLQGAMKMMLEWEGYRVTCAANGQEALDRLRDSAPPGLIVLDLMMPVLDGWQFLDDRQHDPALADIPVLVVTALDEPNLPGTVGQIQKPFQPPELLEAIRQHG